MWNTQFHPLKSLNHVLILCTTYNYFTNPQSLLVFLLSLSVCRILFRKRYQIGIYWWKGNKPYFKYSNFPFTKCQFNLITVMVCWNIFQIPLKQIFTDIFTHFKKLLNCWIVEFWKDVEVKVETTDFLFQYLNWWFLLVSISIDCALLPYNHLFTTKRRR